MEKLTLKKLYNTSFRDLYWRVLIDNGTSEDDFKKILSIGLFLVSLDNKKLNKLGYRLFLLYTRKTKDYIPLYELSINKGLIPISEFIINNLEYGENKGNIYTEINSIINKRFRYLNSFKTIEQYDLYESVNRNQLESQIIVAPTSYGKTELILSFINKKFPKICIITPTKSLLAQTKSRIIKNGLDRKIIVYPEMYNEGDKVFVAILTQERLLRLLQSNLNLNFDLLIVDEAHNLLEGFSKNNLRSIILASSIIICNKRNKNMVIKYLTPFIKNKKSLNLKYMPNKFEWYNVEENIKSELFYYYDLKNNEKKILDQYSTLKKKLIGIEKLEELKDCDVVLREEDSKNIIYLNSPKKIEKFAKELSNKLKILEIEKLYKASKDLKEFIHENYNLSKYILKGILYHHGSMVESVRNFIEELYIEIPNLKYLISNSTLLEGVNIPAKKIFILDPYKGTGYLSSSSFKNLIGRICRFGEIFDNENKDLRYLLPEIYIVNGNYCNKKFNIDNFINKTKILIENEIEDKIENPLLKENTSNLNDIKDAEKILNNISSIDIIDEKYENKAKTNIGKLCFQNNIVIFDILSKEEELEKEVYNLEVINNLDELFKSLKEIFFSKIITNKSFENIKRLKEEKAQSFYKILLNWRIFGLSIREMINNMISYWDSLKENEKMVYVGKWGDEALDGYKKIWTNIKLKDKNQKVNLAIVRLKEEYDFIDIEIMKYIEVLYGLNKIETTFYLKLKHGTDDEDKIFLMNFGLSYKLSELLKNKYENFFEIDRINGMVYFSKGLIQKMEENDENGILITEIKINSKNKKN